MPVIPLGKGAYKRASAFVPEVRCVNMYIEKDDSGISPDGTLRVQRPGLTLDYTLGGSVDAMRHWPSQKKFLTVSNRSVFLDEVRIGGVIGDDPAVTVTTLQGGVVSGGRMYVVSPTSVEQVNIPENYLASDVDQLNGYMLVLTTTGRFYWLVPGASTIDALDFATAESSGDEGRAIRRLGDEIFIFGSDSTEVWQSTGDQDAPFSRAPGRLYQRGCLARNSVCRFDNSLVWVGDDGAVYRLGSVPQAISSPGMDERIRRRAGPLSAWVHKIDGHEFYNLRIPGEGVFSYDASTQEWCEFTWLVRVGETVDGVTKCADNLGNVYRLDAANPTDNGAAFERVVTGTVGMFGKGPRNDSFSVGVGSSGPCDIRVRWQDGQDGYPAYYDEVSVIPPMDVATIYRLGEPEQPQRTFEVSCIDPVIIRIAGAVANEAWGGGNA